MEKQDKRDSLGKPNKKKKSKILVAFFRWFALAFIITYCLFARDAEDRHEYFFLFFTLAVIYNILVTMYLLKSKTKNKSKLKPVIYIDILIIAFFTAVSGGADSDIYALLLFIIGYSGIFIEKPFALSSGLLSTITYVVFSLYAATGIEGINHWRLGLRAIFLLFATFGILIISNEMKKYGELHKKEFKLARTDKLTGLANRHYFDQKLEDEAEYAIVSGNPLNILMFDLDNFKKFNDTYGHVWGDKLLALFSDIIKQNIRKSDIPVRYGGEEFLLLLRDLDMATAKSVGERIRKQLEKQRIYIENDESRRKVTVSCGVAQFPKHSPNIKEAIDLADKALYFAKGKGKNMVVSYDEMDGLRGRIV